MLTTVYDGAEKECKIDIAFEPAADGTQQNDCRDLIVRCAEGGQIDAGRAIAGRLQSVTTQKSGLGLLFLLLGEEDDGATKVVISRFPADNGIVADQKKGELSVQFLERVFMKRATTYKAAVYRGHSLTGEFWEGRMIDKQVNSGTMSVSNYWIAEFLASDFRTTSAQGSRRLADALRNATADTKDISVKTELVAALRMSRNFAGHRELLILTCTEIEACWLGVLKSNSPPGNHKKIYKTTDYVGLHVPMKLEQWNVRLKDYPTFPALEPFAGWDPLRATQSLAWYDAYNAVKHDREGDFSRVLRKRHQCDGCTVCDAVRPVGDLGLFNSWRCA